jgi:hypothetical protein
LKLRRHNQLYKQLFHQCYSSTSIEQTLENLEQSTNNSASFLAALLLFFFFRFHFWLVNCVGSIYRTCNVCEQWSMTSRFFRIYWKIKRQFYCCRMTNEMHDNEPKICHVWVHDQLACVNLLDKSYPFSEHS